MNVLRLPGLTVGFQSLTFYLMLDATNLKPGSSRQLAGICVNRVPLASRVKSESAASCTLQAIRASINL